MPQFKIREVGNTWLGLPAGGVGVPTGGTEGQVLTKSSATDYATEWADAQTPDAFCTYSEFIDISSYTSASNYYQAPCDGYFYMSAYQRTGTMTILAKSGTNLQFSVSASGENTMRNWIFVRKGTRAFVASAPNSAYFIPLDSFY